MPSIALTPMANFASGEAVHRFFVRTTRKNQQRPTDWPGCSHPDGTAMYLPTELTQL